MARWMDCQIIITLVSATILLISYFRPKMGKIFQNFQNDVQSSLTIQQPARASSWEFCFLFWEAARAGQAGQHRERFRDQTKPARRPDITDGSAFFGLSGTPCGIEHTYFSVTPKQNPWNKMSGGLSSLAITVSIFLNIFSIRWTNFPP